MKTYLLFFALLLGISTITIGQIRKPLTPAQDSILTRHLKRGAWKYSYYSKQWEQHIDEGIAEDSTIAYLWQQKGMPYFKKQKYEIGMDYLNKAVYYDNYWLNYRAFMKCIFVKNYRSALVDFEQCNQTEPNGYVMDHSYNFYMALCYLQLNDYTKAFTLLNNEVKQTQQTKGPEWQHPTVLFYLGICYYELSNYTKAIETFNQAIALYPNFSDAKYYKGKCYAALNEKTLEEECKKDAETDFKNGYTINEDNVIYEQYPYQVNWKLHHKN